MFLRHYINIFHVPFDFDGIFGSSGTRFETHGQQSLGYSHVCQKEELTEHRKISDDSFSKGIIFALFYFRKQLKIRPKGLTIKIARKTCIELFRF